MTADSIARMLLEHKRLQRASDPVRYASTEAFRYLFPEIYGAKPPAGGLRPSMKEAAGIVVPNQQKEDMLVDILRGEMPPADELGRVLGLSAAELSLALDRKDPVIEKIPDKLVVLTFDDATIDHYTHAAPVLEKYGFNATFFITGLNKGEDSFASAELMTWDEVKALDEKGYEIGNHTLNHKFPSESFDEEDFIFEMERLNELCEKHGVTKPVSLAYPGGGCTGEMVRTALKSGFLWARGNLNEGFPCVNGTTVYDPAIDCPLCAPSYGDAPFFTLDRLLRIAGGAKDGNIVILAYHEVENPDEWGGEAPFEDHMRCLYENGFKAISMRQLGSYIDPLKAVDILI